MARGWESKSVEAQIELAEAPIDRSSHEQLGTEELELLRKKESLTLSRTRVLRELETSRNPRYLRMMEKALTDLDAELERLEHRGLHVATA